jgi:hypothetical protein
VTRVLIGEYLVPAPQLNGPMVGFLDLSRRNAWRSTIDFRHESLPRARRSKFGKLLSPLYAAFFGSAFTFAHLARCAAAIFLREDDDMVRFAGLTLVFLPTDIDCERPRTLAHRARCACAILCREAADTTWAGRIAFACDRVFVCFTAVPSSKRRA